MLPLKSEKSSEADTDWLEGSADLLRALLPILETWKLALFLDCMRFGEVLLLPLLAENYAIFLGVCVGL